MSHKNTSNLFSKRNNCRLCECEDVQLVVPLNPTPVAEKYLLKKDLSKENIVCPLDLYICNECGHVQLLDIVEPNFLYSDYTYSSGASKGLVNHFESYANSILENYKPIKNSLILDIGSNDGTLLKFFKNKGLRVLGVDPAEEIANKATKEGIETIPKFFNLTLSKEILQKYGPPKIITANNAFAHMDNLDEIMKGIHMLMDKSSIFVFEVSYLLDVVEKVLLGTIFHEHHSYHSVTPLNIFFNKFDMEIIHLERNNIQGGSLIGIVQFKDGMYKKNDSVDKILELEKESNITKPETLKKFSKNLNHSKNQIINLLNSLSINKKTIAGFGAARSGTTLISQMEIAKFINFIVDDNKFKQGKYSPAGQIIVKPTEYIYKAKPDYLIILAWVHSKNIIKNHKKYLDQGGSFIVCFPELKVINKSNMNDL
jgi:SAM-dependent methyltransferase